ncbi:GNAT family N-acetyltransferase [Virgibacillus flavescens]|uniref:GNAT family N-acetyltransferase n=1 Tax=Virgibacillus flavescens TaxID=1611422 RepID=UPI003D34BF79
MSLFKIDCGDVFLQEFTIENIEDIYSITSEPEVCEFLPDWKSTREQRHHWVTNYEIPSNKDFLSSIPEIDGQNFLKLGIIEKESGKFIGFCNTGIKEELPEPNREISYAITKDYRNKGYTTEAVKGLVNFLFEKTNVNALNIVVLPNNEGSIKVIEKSGFSFKANVEIENQKHYHYTLEKENWKVGKSEAES